MVLSIEATSKEVAGTEKAYLELGTVKSMKETFSRKFHGPGTYTFRNGDSFEGTFKTGRFGREGVYKFKNGTIYTGQFSSRAMHGRGQLQFQDGSSYKGGFSMNKPSGPAVYNNGGPDIELNCENGSFYILSEEMSQEAKTELRQELAAQFALVNL